LLLAVVPSLELITRKNEVKVANVLHLYTIIDALVV